MEKIEGMRESERRVSVVSAMGLKEWPVPRTFKEVEETTIDTSSVSDAGCKIRCAWNFKLPAQFVNNGVGSCSRREDMLMDGIYSRIAN